MVEYIRYGWFYNVMSYKVETDQRPEQYQSIYQLVLLMDMYFIDVGHAHTNYPQTPIGASCTHSITLNNLNYCVQPTHRTILTKTDLKTLAEKLY